MYEGAPKIENGPEKPLIKEGVEFVFTQNPELQKIGTKEQYSEYLDTIFPESTKHDIFYRGDILKSSLPVNLENTYDVYLTKDIKYAFQYGDKITTSIINTKNPYYTKDMPGMYWKRINDTSDRLYGHDSVILDNPNELIISSNQIHVLGTSLDIEKFKEFVSKKQF